MSKENLVLPRSESSFADRRELHKRRRAQSQLSAVEHLRSSSKYTPLPSITAYCSHCKLPLLIDLNTRETNNKSRASATRNMQRLCKECTEDTGKNDRASSSSLHKTGSVDWTNVGDKIETWFEKARTPDQRVVYNFLEQINTDQGKELDRAIETAQGKSLDDILINLKQYRTRFNSARNPKKFNRVFESTSWRVMRHPTTTPRQFSRYNAVYGPYGDEASRDFHISSIFTKTEPRIGSTFLLHPNWV